MNALPALVAVSAALLVMWANPALPGDRMAIRGQATAEDRSIARIRQTLELAAMCFKIDAISVSAVPADFDPKSVPTIPSTLGPGPIEPVRFESWSVEGCGHNLKFTVQLWYDTYGQERFAVITPKGWLNGS